MDVLVISAFNNNYAPLPSTVIGGLYKKGLSVGELAKNKKVDLRNQYGCWLSADLAPQQQEQFHFKRILCFEPHTFSNKPHEVVSNIFRCINHFAFEDENNSVAMSLISTGNMKEEVNIMFTALLEAALFWLRQGLPLDTIKIVHHNKTVADSLKISMRDFKNKNNLNKEESITKSVIEEKVAPPPFAIPPLPPAPAAASPSSSKETKKPDIVLAQKDDFEFDIFISYAHVNTDVVNAFVAFLNEINPELKIFHDKESIDVRRTMVYAHLQQS